MGYSKEVTIWVCGGVSGGGSIDFFDLVNAILLLFRKLKTLN